MPWHPWWNCSSMKIGLLKVVDLAGLERVVTVDLTTTDVTQIYRALFDKIKRAIIFRKYSTPSNFSLFPILSIQRTLHKNQCANLLGCTWLDGHWILGDTDCDGVLDLVLLFENTNSTDPCVFKYYKIKQSCAVVSLIGPGGRCLETCLQTGPTTCRTKGVLYGRKGVRQQAKFAYLKTCWIHVIMVWGTVG